MKNTSHFIFVFFFCIFITDTSQLHAQVPTLDSAYPLRGSIGSLMTIKGSKMDYSKYIAIGTTNELIISAEDTQAVVMIMPGTTTDYITITSFSNGHSIYADNFVVVPSSPPNKQLGNKLLDSAGTSSQQGFAVAISADGNTAAVGAADNTGGVLIYSRNNNIWTQQGTKLTGTGAVGNAFQGYSVALSADGNTIIEGGVGDNGFTGASWIFVRDKNNVWSQQGNKLVGSGLIIVQGTTPEQGYAVSISANGNTAITGGRRDSNYVGAAWVFTRSNNVWTEQQKLIGTGYVNIINVQGFLQHYPVQMGSSVALSADGNTALIGGPNDNNNTGAVWVFVKSGNTFLQQGNKLIGSGGYRSYYGGIQQGTSVAVSADGNTAVIGAPFDSDSAAADHTKDYANGAIWIFIRNGNTWAQQGNKLFATDAGLGAEQGWSVSVSADGNTAIVGAPTDSSYVGGTWIYKRNNNVWSQASNKLLGTGYFGAPKQGWSSSISADGTTAIVGGPENDPLGAAWVFADTSNSVLAVSFANFKAYISGKDVQTTWTGFNETDLNSYDVERSAKGYYFNKQANIPVKSNKALQNNYSWLDASSLSGNNFYRIKAISKDGSVQYSSIIKINIGDKQSSIQVYPNPSDGLFTLMTKMTNKKAEVIITNAEGRIVYQNTFYNTSSASIQLHTTKGIYLISVKTDAATMKQKLVIQ